MINTADSGKRLVRVEINACRLSGTLTAETSLTVTQSCFVEGDTVLIGDEEILLGASGDNLTFTCTRAQNGTSVTTHLDGSFVLKATGATLLSHTFAAGEYINLIWLTGFAEARFRVTVTETDASVSYWWAATTPYVLTFPLPCARRAPGAGATILVEAWTEYSQDAMSAVIQG